MAAYLEIFLSTIALLIVTPHAFTTLQVKLEKPLQFSYSGSTGPDRWASLNPNFTLCATGKSQSPIDIVTDQAVPGKELKPLIREYSAANVTLVDYKFTVGIEYPDQTGSIFVYEKEYKLKQMHWHSPSEHRINGNRYVAELHMVHVSNDGNVTVVATVFEYGQPDPVLGKIHNQLYQLADDVESRISVGLFHPAELRTTPIKYYRYVGSFSAPPCTENIPYIVLAEARSISREQVQALKAPLDIRCKNNARSVQPINGRRVDVYEEGSTAGRRRA